MKFINYYILTIMSIAVLACTPKENISFKHNNKMYYCAYVNYLELVLAHPIDSINSIGDFEFTKIFLNGIAPI